MVNTKIRLIIFFAAKDGEALYSQQKQDWELTVAQIPNCQIQTEIEESGENHYTIQVWPKSNLDLLIYNSISLCPARKYEQHQI